MKAPKKPSIIAKKPGESPKVIRWDMPFMFKPKYSSLFNDSRTYFTRTISCKPLLPYTLAKRGMLGRGGKFVKDMAEKVTPIVTREMTTYNIANSPSSLDTSKVSHPTVIKTKCGVEDCEKTNCPPGSPKCDPDTTQNSVVGHVTHKVPKDVDEDSKVVQLSGTNVIIYGQEEVIRANIFTKMSIMRNLTMRLRIRLNTRIIALTMNNHIIKKILNIVILVIGFIWIVLFLFRYPIRLWLIHLDNVYIYIKRPIHIIYLIGLIKLLLILSNIIIPNEFYLVALYECLLVWLLREK